MKINKNKAARQMVNTLLSKNGKTSREISEAMGYAQKNEVSKILSGSHHCSPEKLAHIIQAINENYELNIRFISPKKYRVCVYFKGNPQIVDGYNVEEK